MKRLYIIDFSNWVYKFKYVFDLTHDLSSGETINTSVLYGFYSSLKSHPFNDIIIALDGCPLLSQSILPQYKQQRIHSNSNQLFVPKREIIAFLSKLGPVVNKQIRVVGSYGQEADQVIASLTQYAIGKARASLFDPERKSLKEDPYLGKYVENLSPLQLDSDYEMVVIGSTDSDIYALTDAPQVYMDQSWNGSRIGWEKETPKAVCGLPANLIPIYKAFCGDVSDNVPAIVESSHLKSVRSIISQTMTTRKEFFDFCTKVRLNLPLSDAWRLLANWVVEGRGVKELRRNFSVVELKFEGLPQLLDFPTYSIESTFAKYALQV